MTQKQHITDLAITTIRTLAMDAVQAANSGHPGAPMGLAPVAFTLWDKFIRFDPKEPNWPNRDRFILSAGHASMLLYSVLHIMGFDISLDDIKKFRQLHGKCAGHPEFGLAPGVETTTGPLGQGAANSVGFASAERWLAQYFNRPNHQLIDYHTFAIVSDGCIMEGVTAEAASIAGHLGLNKLIWLYDNNHITIEGDTALAFSEDVGARFEAYGWFVQHVKDANDLPTLEHAIGKARQESNRPSLIIVDSHIAFGSPNKQDNAESHGSPLGEEEVKLTKKSYGWDPEQKFLVPEEIKTYRDTKIAQGRKLSGEWQLKLAAYAQTYPDLAKQFKLLQAGQLPEGWEASLPTFPVDPKGLASREASHKVLNALAEKIPWLLGGAADLLPSTKSNIKSAPSFQKNQYQGRNFHFGIREHAMGAIVNGMALSKLRAYAATFFIFSDYMRPPIRLAALMGLPVIYIFTHDSIAVGEDGPTHQPIEQLASLRTIPNLDVIRPADANEVSVLWRHVLRQTERPAMLVLTRQAIPTIDRNKYASAEAALRGGYILADCEGTPEVILLATGSEVHLCLEAFEQLKQQGIRARVVSMPCWSLFDRQDSGYREQVLPTGVQARLAVEAGASLGWQKYTGADRTGRILGIDRFGASAPFKDLLNEYGFTVANIVANALQVIAEAHALEAAKTNALGTSLAGFDKAIADGLTRLRNDQIVQRIWRHDHTVWKPNPTEITNRLGWLHSPSTMPEALVDIEKWLSEVRQAGFTRALLLGMGGSSLAPEVFRFTFGVKPGFLDLAVLDSTDPGAVLAQARKLDPTRTLMIVSTKSGGTVETFSLMKFFYNYLQEKVGPEKVGQHFVAITDPGSGLESVAKQLKFGKIFLNDPNIGGRYSALTLFGLVPAALIGMDVRLLLERAKAMTDNSQHCDCPAHGANTSAQLGVILGVLAQAGRDKLTLIASPGLAAFGTWVEQLIAESTGKDGKGILPVDGEYLAAPEVYTDDRLFVYLRLVGDSTHDAGVQALKKAGQSVLQINLSDPYDLGGEFFRWEFATAVCGWRLGIQPFDQPNVESAKVLARQMVAAFQKNGHLPEMTPKLIESGISVYTDLTLKNLDQALKNFLVPANGGGSVDRGRSYVAIQAYIEPTEAATAALQKLRSQIQRRYRLATTVGFGPRFLHSTGQLHKGDAGQGLFIQFTAAMPEDIAIPEEAGANQSSISFGVLKTAQALGDRQALIENGRQVICFDLGTNVTASLNLLTKTLE